MSGISVAELVSILWNVEIWPNDLAVPRTTTELCRRSFSVAAPVIWNIWTCPPSPEDIFGVDWKTASFSRPTRSENLVLKSLPNWTELSVLQFSSLDVPDMIVWLSLYRHWFVSALHFVFSFRLQLFLCVPTLHTNSAIYIFQFQLFFSANYCVLAFSALMLLIGQQEWKSLFIRKTGSNNMKRKKGKKERNKLN